MVHHVGLGRFDNQRKACTYYHVSENGLERGIVSAGESPKLDTWLDKRKRINLLIERITQEDEKEMRDVLIEKGYEDVRGSCGIVVEQDLLQKVVQSYSPNVMIGNLLRLKFDDLKETSSTVNEICDRCCRFIGSHKQPLETLSVRPTLEQLEQDWKARARIKGCVKERRRTFLLTINQRVPGCHPGDRNVAS